MLLLETISSVRMLVNGSQGLVDSLTITDDNDLARVTSAYAVGYDARMTSLNNAPLAVNIIFGGTKDNPALWHEVALHPSKLTIL